MYYKINKHSFKKKSKKSFFLTIDRHVPLIVTNSPSGTILSNLQHFSERIADISMNSKQDREG